MTDNRKSAITTKIAAQLVEYYKNATQFLADKEASQLLTSKRAKVENIKYTFCFEDFQTIDMS